MTKNRFARASSRARLSVGKCFAYLVLILFAALCLFPFYMLAVNATRSTAEIQQSVSFFFSDSFLENYRSLTERGLNIIRAFFNSAFIAVVSSGLNVYVSALTAFAFHCYDFKGKKLLYYSILLVIMIPGQLGLIGFYQFMLQLGWIDSYWPLILPSMASAANVFFLRQFYQATLGRELLEAARIDGSGEFHSFNRIILPISVPALATIGIGAFVGSWNNYLMPFILISTESKYTMPMLVQMLKTNIFAVDIGAIYTGLLLTVLPLLAVYIFLFRFIVSGVAVGGVKE